MRAQLPFLMASGLAFGLVFGPPAYGTLQSETYPDCAEDGTLDACPEDLTQEDGSWRGITWSFTSFVNEEYKSHVRREEWGMGSGNWFDKASQVTMGRLDVTVAVIDSGIRWRMGEFTPKTLLNEGELPTPQRADGTACADSDCNGDGFFTVPDFANDSRVSITDGADDADNYLDPSDLIAAFSDGVDGDNNGYIDDIAGWDFMWNDNDPRASNDFYHGSAVMTDSVASAGQRGSSLGYCPNCSILPVRASDSFIGEANKIALGVVYAVERGAKVIAIAMGGITNSDFLKSAFEYAWANDVTVVVAIGDEMSYHHLPPGANDFTLPVHTITHYPFVGAEYSRSFLAFRGCNNYGAHLALVAATNDCATGSTAIIAGVAGMVYSRGRELGMELSADEVRAILTGTAHDIDVPESRRGPSPYFPSYPGWDQFFGYGRVNVHGAVSQVRDGAIPPEVRILSPRWYSYHDPAQSPTIDIDVAMAAPRAAFYDYQLLWAPGADPRPGDFRIIAAGTSDVSVNGLLFRWRAAEIPRSALDPAEPMGVISGDDPLIDKLETVNAHTITLKLVATDDRGNEAEHRKAFFLHEDPDLLPSFPKRIGPGDSSPLMADINGDGVKDIVVATSDGQIHAYRGDGSNLPGWPVQVGHMPATDPDAPAGHSDAAPYAEDGLTPARQGVFGSVKVGDLEGDGDAEVIVSTLDGYVFAFNHLGRPLAGFPVTRDPVSDADTSELVQMDPGFAASPALADLDGDGSLEIIAPAMDQKLYVWRADGSTQPGFPVLVAYDRTEAHNRGRIMSSPAVGDIDGDGTLEIVFGTNEYDATRLWLTYAYAVHHDGNLHSGGPLVRGWPVELMSLLNSVVRYMGEGVTMNPDMADVDGDGDMEVAFAAPGWCPVIVGGRGNILVETACGASGWGALSDANDVAAATYLANVKFADLDQDGTPELIGGVTGMNWALSVLLSRWVPYQDHMVLVWDSQTGDALEAWPRVIEDIMMFVQAGAGDVSGDGLPDVVMSSGGYNVHAWDIDGTEHAGWPKLTGGWVYSSIQVGDVTGDGFNEVVATTREGYLFAWGTDGLAQE